MAGLPREVGGDVGAGSKPALFASPPHPALPREGGGDMEVSIDLPPAPLAITNASFNANARAGEWCWGEKETPINLP